MFFQNKNKAKIFSLFLLLTIILGQFSLAQPVRAQFGIPQVNFDPMAYEQRTAIAIGTELDQTWDAALLSTALGGLLQGATYFFSKLAYDGAKYIASGGKGQGALAFQDGFYSYLQDTTGDAVADSINAIGAPFGLDLCHFPDVNFQIMLQISIGNLFGPVGEGPQPSCRWKDMEDSWGAGLTDLNKKLKRLGRAPATSIEEMFSRSLRENQSDFGLALSAIGNVDRINADALLAGQLDRLEGEGFKGVSDLISGNIRTPAGLVKEEAKVETSNYQTQITAGQVAGIYASGAAQIIPYSISIFLNTLISDLVRQLFEEGLLPEKGGGGAGNVFAGPIQDNRAIAERAFSFLMVKTPMQLNAYDIISTYATCPDSPGLNNCVLDSDLQSVIVRANQGEPITILEAMDVKSEKLHRDWKLIPPSRPQDNQDLKNCYKNAYCYSNIQKLRKARILPLGFEIAALRSNPDSPWTLGTVVDNFENCNEFGKNDAEHPYCHLIDPKWIIKAPEASCEAYVYGPQLASPNAAIRQEDCVDLSTCITRNADGSCADYGYCTKEKNVWNLPGVSCPAEYATCKTYINTGSGAVTSYLSRSVDYGDCNLDSVGCRAYSADQLGGAWIDSSVVLANRDDYLLAGRNQSLYFNDRINTQNQQCNVSDDGCNKFFTGGGSVNLKAAPAYNGCYDTNTGTPAINWPRTPAELNLLSQSSECDKFASVCLPSESGCESYTQNNNNAVVPAIVGTNNWCNAECVGYDTFKQIDNQFEPEKDLMYFIPTNAQMCPAEANGCSEFTNLEERIAGGETREYYSQIKYCEKPLDPNTNEKTFYTWEGTLTEGYVLRTHKLKFISDAEYSGYYGGLTSLTDEVKNYMRSGSPAYADLRSAELMANYELCNQTNYLNRINNTANTAEWADPDCREFYDDNGEIYYRLLNKTVTISDECHAMRKTEPMLFTDVLNSTQCTAIKGLPNTAGTSCQICYGGGEYENGACIYHTIARQSVSCRGYNNCRGYAGNAGSNVYVVTEDHFEPDGTDADALVRAKEDWVGGVVAMESIQVGGHSLRVDGTAERTIAPNTLLSTSISPLYELTFWARGDLVSVAVGFYQGSDEKGIFTVNPITTNPQTISIGSDWRQYKLGPIKFSGLEDVNTTLQFARSGGTGVYFLDNVKLSRVQGIQYLIKDTWRTKDGDVQYEVPLTCDSNPDDIFPGTALGCRAYTAETSGLPAYTTGFERLCREKAVGCRPLINSFNTSEENAVAYNVWCAQTTAGECKLYNNCLGNSGTCAPSGDEAGICTVKTGESGCYIDKVVIPASTNVDNFLNSHRVTTSTIFIPADTPTSTPIFLAVRPEFQCSSEALGCQKMGQELKVSPGNTPSSFTFNDVYLLNNPTKYIGSNGTLCRNDLIACSEYEWDGGTSYFKDPILTGNQVCEYKTGDSTGGALVQQGWYLTGTSQPCYPNYLTGNNEYGLVSNRTSNYMGFVGACNEQSNLCTELIDPIDTKNNAGGQPYYVIFDDTVSSRAGDCLSKASQREGCVLFNKTENPRLSYNAESTYIESEKAVKANQSSLVTPSTTPTPLDSNLILKVDRDRECAEWLSCRRKTVYKDSNGKSIEICDLYAPCTEDYPNGSCKNFVSTDGNYLDSFLTQENYVKRDTGWSGWEYSGYSMFNHFPVGEYSHISVSNGGQEQRYLVYKVDKNVFDADSGYPDSGCVESDGALKENWLNCGFDGLGRCYNGNCVYPIDGGFSSGFNFSTLNNINWELEAPGCKAYPEESSPFPVTVLAGENLNDILNDPKIKLGDNDLFRYKYIEKKPDFVGANVCQGEDNCSCKYKKIIYKNGVVDYWPFSYSSTSTPPTGICSGGIKDGREMDGLPCSPNGEGDCGEGVCNAQDTIEKHIGTAGFCLERDLSRPIEGGRDLNNSENFTCLTWLPTQASVTGEDLYNSNPDAGYNPVTDAPDGGGEVYCQESTQTGAGEYVDVAQFQNYQSRVYNNYGPYTESNPSLVLLRYDHTLTLDIDHGTANHNWWGDVFGFAPNWGENGYCSTVDGYTYSGDTPNFRDCYSDNPWVYTDSRGFGTMMHPPRFSIPSVVDLKMSLTYNNEVNDPEGVFQDPKRIVNSWFLSPSMFGFNVSSVLSGDQNTLIWRSPLEASLRENDLKKVYFKERINYFSIPEMQEAYLSIFNISEEGDIQMEINFDALRGLSDELHNNQYLLTGDEIKNYNKYYRESGSEITVDDRDVVQKRYIAFWSRDVNGGGDGRGDNGDPCKNADGDEINCPDSYRVVSFGPNDGQDDPFTTSKCGLFRQRYNDTTENHPDQDYHYASRYGNWLAIGMDFNAEGEFLGYISRWCSSQQISYVQQKSINVFAQLKDHCTKAVQVYDDGVNPITGWTNKAWTDRVWIRADQYPEVGGAIVGPAFKRDLSYKPYGSLPLGSDSVQKIITEDSGTYNNLRNNVFESPLLSGVPFSCYGSWLPGSSLFDEIKRCEGLGAEYRINIYSDTFYSPPVDHYLLDDIASVGDNQNDNALKEIERLFVKIFNTAVFSYDNVGIETANLEEGEDVGGTAGQTNLGWVKPPQVYSLNPAKCNTSDPNIRCTAGEKDNITVNWKNFTLKDYNVDDNSDEDLYGARAVVDGYDLIGQGTFDATIRFFAFADKNAMPLRRIMIDWDDGSDIQNQETYGLYKNRKPYCGGESGQVATCYDRNLVTISTDPGVDTQLTCANNEECLGVFSDKANCSGGDVNNFGNASRACEEDYFQFSYNYGCGEKEKSEGHQKTVAYLNSGEFIDIHNRLLSMGLTDSSPICIFQPKVQVLDNWGWCNGRCVNESNVLRPEGCYGQVIDHTEVFVDVLLPRLQHQNQCDTDLDGNNRWTEFYGYVVVIPEE